MPMPEAAVHENRLLVLWQHDVGATGQFFPVQAETVTHRVKQPPYDQFRSCIFALDRLHNAAALFGATSIHRTIMVSSTRGVQRRYDGAVPRQREPW